MQHHIGYKQVEVATRKQKPRKPSCFCGLNIGCAITNHEAAFTSYWPTLYQVVNHAGIRLSPMVIFEIARYRSLGMVSAISDVVDVCALPREFCAHPIVQGTQLIFG